jgi:trimeric autotransporter adhesin
MRPLQIIAGFLFGSIFFAMIAAAWTGPTGTAPANNVAAPINVGTTYQIKNGNIGVSSLAVFGNTLLQANSYLNWGATAASTGYGIRDNSGTLEFKNSGSSWASIQSTVNTLLNGSGQWTTGSGGAIYYNGGNVGVGTASPGQKLEVNGEARFGPNPWGEYTTIGGWDPATHASVMASNGNLHIDAKTGGYGLYLNYFASGPIDIGSGGGATTIHNSLNVTGNVGIGTASPQQNLSVNGAVNIDQANGNNGSAVNPGLTFGSNSGEGISSPRSGTNTYGLNFYTNFAPRMVVQSGSGNVGIGTQSPDRPLEVTGQIEAHQPQGTTDGGFRLKGPPDNSYSVIQFVNNAGNSEWQYIAATPQNNIGIGTTNPSQRLDVTGNVLAYGYQYYSDISLKKDIAPIMDALSKVLGLEGVSFLWKAHPEQGPQIGFIAQDVEKIVPELVTTAPSGLKSVDYARVSALLVNAIKQLESRVSTTAHLVIDTLSAHHVNADDATVQKLCVSDGPTDASPLCVTKSQLAALLAK